MQPPPDQIDEPPPLTDRFLAAVGLAQQAHGRQRRQGTNIPYLAHLLVVTGLVVEDGGDEDEAVAAMLHDAVEDGGGRPMLERIEQTFGPRVAEIVTQLSDSIEPEDRAKPWIDRKAHYLEHLTGCDDQAAIRIGLADKVHNSRSLVRDYRQEGPALWARFSQRTADQQLWYYGQLVALFEIKKPGSLTEDLTRSVNELTAMVDADRD